MNDPTALPYTLLVVDDEDLVLSVTEAILKRAGATVLAAKDAETALAHMDQHGESVDAALIDLNLGRTGGRALADQLRRTRADLRVLFMSGYSDAQPELGDPRAAFVAKPFRRVELIEALQPLLKLG